MTTYTEPLTGRVTTPQGSHHWIITLDLPGRATATWHGTYTPAPAATRQDAYDDIRRLVTQDRPTFADANVTYFALETNQL